MQRLWTIAVMAVGLFGTSCVAMLDWDLQSEMKCDAQQQCADGFSCLGSFCIEDGTIPKGKTCILDRQCADGLICPPEVFTCSVACNADNFFASDTKCSTGEYCRPVRASSTSDWIGVCVEGDDCSTCAPGSECVQVAPNTDACLSTCEVGFDTNNDYFDNCDHSDPRNLVRCQPVGEPISAQKLVCLSHSNVTPADVGQICQPVTAPCKSGLACIDGVCKPYCSAPGSDTVHCSGAYPVCCQINGGDGTTYNVCGGSC